MKKLTKLMAILMVLALSVMVFAACGGSDNTDTATSQASDTASEENSEAAGADVDYSKPEITLTADDYDGMKTFADAMLAGSYDGKVVKATGYNSRSDFSVKASIMASDGDSAKIGVTYRIQGVEAIDDYPATDAEIEIIGVVATDENGVRYIDVPVDYVKTL